MMVICLGGVSFAHADAHLTKADISSLSSVSAFSADGDLQLADVLPAMVTLQINESLNLAPFFAKAHFSTTQKIQDDGDNALIWNFSQSVEKKQGEQHSSQGHTYHLGLTNSSRQASLARHDQEEVQPCYQLAIELPVPPAPIMMIGYTERFSESVNWMLNTNPPSSRISGWKESNLTHSRYQHQLSHA
ncbi:hypothetical protein [Photobacterium lipolyticum]|nr:hypothetical protein [Photobacterium lipolyticum]